MIKCYCVSKRATANTSLLGVALTALLAAPLAQANPVVNGLEISWPDDGWYQVQSADGLTNFCEGKRSCLVEPGRYIVINHTTGQRFEDIVVADEGTHGNPAQVTVAGSTISWPDDGWYQVQSASTYESICQGGLSCAVEDGSYIVINHTTGERFENIVVPADEAPSQITVEGGTISWPDDGWYQVQAADTYNTPFCEGGRNCDVPPGEYIVINHTTGTRFTDIVVEGDDMDYPPLDSGLELDLVSNDVIFNLAGFQFELNTMYSAAMASNIIDDSIDETALDAGQFLVDSQGEILPQATERTRYSCASGGTMTMETGDSIIDESPNTHDTEYASYDFDNCQVFIGLGVPGGQGNYVFNGTLALSSDKVYNDETRYYTEVRAIHYSDYDVRGENGQTFQADGQVISDEGNTDTGESHWVREATINHLLLVNEVGTGAQPTESISDATLTQTYFVTDGGDLRKSSLDVEGRTSGYYTDGIEVSVTTPATLNRTIGTGSLLEQTVAFNGQMQLSAADGSELSITGNPEIDEDEGLLVDYKLLRSNGETRETVGAPFIDYRLHFEE